MLAPTHLAFSQACYFAACVATGHTAAPLEAIVAAVGSQLPDIDKRHSYIGRCLPWLSGWVEHRFGHRRMTHSLLAQVVGVGLLAWLVNPWIAMSLGVGWLSHSFADMMTPSGVAWFWPSRIRVVLPGNPRYRVELMSWAEFSFAVLSLLLAIALVVPAMNGSSPVSLIRESIGDLSKARQQFDEEKGDHVWQVTLEGRDNTSFAEIDGTYDVIAPWAASGLLVDTGEEIRSVCDAGECQWYAEHAVLKKGEKQKVTTFEIDAKRMSFAALLSRVDELEQYGAVFLLGRFKSSSVLGEEPVIRVGSEVRLNYATGNLLQQYRRKTMSDVSITLQVRHLPHVVIPELAAEPVDVSSGLSPLLQRWVE